MARIRQSRTFRKILNNEEYDIENPELADAENMNIEDEIIGGATEDDLNKVASDMEIATEEMDVNEQIANDVEEQIEANEQAIEEGNVTEEEARVSQECLQLAMRDLNMSESDITYLRFTTESINRDPKQVLVANNEALGGIWEKAKEMAKKAWEAIKKFFRKIIDFFKKILPTRKNKLLKLQKILKDINGSSVHEEIQDEWDSVAEDKFMAFLNLTEGKIQSIPDLIDGFTTFTESTVSVNTCVQKMVDICGAIPSGLNIQESKALNDELKAKGLSDKNYGKLSPGERLKLFSEIEKSFETMSDIVKKLYENMKKYITSKESEIKFAIAESAISQYKTDGVCYPLDGTTYRTIVNNFEDVIKGNKPTENTDEAVMNAAMKMLKEWTIEASDKDYTKLEKKVELDKSTALDNIEEMIKQVNAAEKKITKYESSATKAIDRMEKDSAKQYDALKEKNAEEAKIVKKVAETMASNLRKYISITIEALNTYNKVQYNYTVAYATHTIKGIKKKETDKENNK